MWVGLTGEGELSDAAQCDDSDDPDRESFRASCNGKLLSKHTHTHTHARTHTRARLWSCLVLSVETFSIPLWMRGSTATVRLALSEFLPPLRCTCRTFVCFVWTLSFHVEKQMSLMCKKLWRAVRMLLMRGSHLQHASCLASLQKSSVTLDVSCDGSQPQLKSWSRQCCTRSLGAGVKRVTHSV